MPEPSNKELYERVKKKIYAKNPKHSAYRSGLLVKEYKKQGGTYKGSKSSGKGLSRWFKVQKKKKKQPKKKKQQVELRNIRSRNLDFIFFLSIYKCHNIPILWSLQQLILRNLMKSKC